MDRKKSESKLHSACHTFLKTSLPSALQEISNIISHSSLEQYMPTLLQATKEYNDKDIIDILQPLAFLQVKQENITLLSQLLQTFPNDLLNCVSRDNGDTLLLAACKLSKLQSVECLLDNGADPNLTNFHKNTPAMAAVYSNKSDLTSYYILEKLYKKGANFTLRDRDGDTVLIESLSSKLSLCSHFIIHTLEKKDTLSIQLDLKNNNSSAHGIITARELIKQNNLEQLLEQEFKGVTNLDLIIEQINMTHYKGYNSNIENKLKELLLKSDSDTIASALKHIFIKQLYHVTEGPDSSFNNSSLLNGDKSADYWGNKFFTSKDILLLELFISAGADLSIYQKFVEKLPSVSKIKAMNNLDTPSHAVILEEDKTKLLELIKSSIEISKIDTLETPYSSTTAILAPQKLSFLLQKLEKSDNESIQSTLQLYNRCSENLLQEWNKKLFDVSDIKALKHQYETLLYTKNILCINISPKQDNILNKAIQVKERLEECDKLFNTLMKLPTKSKISDELIKTFRLQKSTFMDLIKLLSDEGIDSLDKLQPDLTQNQSFDDSVLLAVDDTEFSAYS